MEHIIFIIIFIICVFLIFKKIKRMIVIEREQTEEIKKYDNIIEYLIDNKNKIKLINARGDLAYFKIGYIMIEVYFGSEEIITIGNIKYGSNKRLGDILRYIYAKNRENLILKG